MNGSSPSLPHFSSPPGVTRKKKLRAHTHTGHLPTPIPPSSSSSPSSSSPSSSTLRRQTISPTPTARAPATPRTPSTPSSGHDESITPSSSPPLPHFAPSPAHSQAINIPSSPSTPRLNRGPSILAARIASPRPPPFPPLSSTRHPPPATHPSSLTPVSDDDGRSDVSDPSTPSSLTSKAVDSVIANATRSPDLSFHSPPHAAPPISALSSSLRAYSLVRSSPLPKEERSYHFDTTENKHSSDPTDPHYAITPYSLDGLTHSRTHSPPPAKVAAHSSASSSQLSSMSSSPNMTPMSASPTSPSPYPPSPRDSPSLPPPSLPRPIPGARQSDVVLLPAAFPLTALSSSAPVPSVHLAEDEDDDVSELMSTGTGRHAGVHSKAGLSSHSVQNHHQLLSKSKVERKEASMGISSISHLINPTHPSHPHHDSFKRSRRLSQTSLTDSPRPKESPRPKHSPSPIDPDHMVYVTNAADAGYPGYDQLASHESLDYHTIHNELLRAELSSLTDFDYIADNVQRWCVTLMIGVIIGAIGFASHYGIEHISEVKFNLVASWLSADWRIAFAIYTSFNLGLVLLGSVLIIFFCPAAGGSGIPEVKGFLNGTAISRAMNVKTFAVKFIASITAVASSLPVGPEGPMIHMGAMVGGGISQPRSKTLNLSMPWFRKFHTDRDRRDFIAMGAAAGVASAFGAPLGGVLFAIEEASSFWSQMLTWRTFFACMAATFITNFLLSGVQGQGWGIYDFSQVTEFDVLAGNGTDSYAIWELFPFALMGAISGLTGALFNYAAERLTVMRDAHILHHPRRRLLEMIFLTLVVSTIFFFSPFYFPCQKCPDSTHPNPNIDCSAGDTDSLKKAVQFMCPDKYYSGVATLTFTTEVGTVRHLFSRGSSSEFNLLTLFFFYLIYFALALYSCGAAVAGGLLVPLLIVGASYGRLFGGIMMSAGFSSVDPGVYALIGAASFFSGVTRMTISLSIIMLEITNDLHYLPAIMLTVMTAKWVGDFFTPPIYEGLMELKFIPWLDQEPPIEMDLLVSSDVMATHVKVVTETPRVKDVLALLRSCEHNGFPVVSAHPLHKPIVQEALNKLPKGLGVPVGVPELNPTAERIAHIQAMSKLHSASPAQASAALTQPSLARPNVAKAAAVTSVAKPASLQSSPRGHPITPSAPSPPPSSKMQLLTAGVSAALGHGSGRVLRGLILRKQLIILLQSQVWTSARMLSPLDFRQRMAQMDLKHQLELLNDVERELTIADKEAKMDIRPYMNRSPFSVHYDFHSVFCFRLFRSMGLRHLPVVNDANEVVGIITRKDIIHPIVKMKYDALLGCKEDGYIDMPELDYFSSDDDDNDGGEGPPGPLSPTNGSLPQSRRQRAILQGRKAKLRPALRAYSYLSPMEGSPEVSTPGTPVYSTPTLLSRPLIGISPKEAAASQHKHSFNWSSRLTTRV